MSDPLSRVSDPLPRQLATDLDEAFGQLVDAHGPMVLTLASRLTDPSTGEDIAQEVFLRSYRALSNYDARQRGELSMRPWLATITRNLVRNEYRRRDRKPVFALDAGDEQNDQVAAPTDAAFAAIDSHDQVTQMLAALPDDQRDAVVLRHVVGLSIREVALTMACPIGTAKSHVSRGLGRLRKTFDTPTSGDARPSEGVI